MLLRRILLDDINTFSSVNSWLTGLTGPPTTLDSLSGVRSETVEGVVDVVVGGVLVAASAAVAEAAHCPTGSIFFVCRRGS